MTLQEFLSMGGHGVYVWTSFGSVAFLMLLNWILPVIAHRKLIKDLRRQVTRNNGDVA